MGDRKTVLVVDDQQDILTYFKMVLENHGFNAITSDSAKDALAKAQEVKPDLICLDIQMPKKSGLSLYADIRRDPDLKQPCKATGFLLCGSQLLQKLVSIDHLLIPQFLQTDKEPPQFSKPDRPLFHAALPALGQDVDFLVLR